MITSWADVVAWGAVSLLLIAFALMVRREGFGVTESGYKGTARELGVGEPCS